MSTPSVTWSKPSPNSGGPWSDENGNGRCDVVVDADGVTIWPYIESDYSMRIGQSVTLTRGEWLDLVATVERAYREMDDGE